MSVCFSMCISAKTIARRSFYTHVSNTDRVHNPRSHAATGFRKRLAPLPTDHVILYRMVWFDLRCGDRSDRVNNILMIVYMATYPICGYVVFFASVAEAKKRSDTWSRATLEWVWCRPIIMMIGGGHNLAEWLNVYATIRLIACGWICGMMWCENHYTYTEHTN